MVLLNPAWDMNHLFIQLIHIVYVTRSVVSSQAQWSDGLSQYHSACVHITLILLKMVPKHKNSNASHSDMPNRVVLGIHLQGSYTVSPVDRRE